MKKYLLIISTLVLAALRLAGQTPNMQVSLPYFCGFEDAVENAQWRYSPKAIDRDRNVLNYWTVGHAVSLAGENSLYVSCYEDGRRARYDSVSYGIVVAYRRLVLPAGTYQLSFSWRALGVKNSDYAVACWVPGTVMKNPVTGSIPTNSKSQPVWFTDYRIAGPIFDNEAWTNVTTSITSDGSEYWLIFAWRNEEKTHAISPAGCVDNVQIGSFDCPGPSDLEVVYNSDNTQATLRWKGQSERYEVSYFNHYDKLNVRTARVTTNSFVISDLENGVYNFSVRGICGKDTSIWSSISNQLVYTADGCINFIDFKNPNTTCYIGNVADPFQRARVVDRGYSSRSSRHTVHYLPEEYDANTNFRLKTVPEGEFASVRLGNDSTGAQGEAIRYRYAVSPNAGILLMRYACVMESAHENQLSVQPRFRLSVRDRLNRELYGECGEADFVAAANTTGWNHEGIVLFKDWTLFGINLQRHVGDTLTISIVTTDCTAGGHFGYAYFTMRCVDQSFEGLSCGDEPVDTVWAPEGFKYEWYKQNPDGSVDFSRLLTTDRWFVPVGHDTSTYVCRNINVEDPSCYFDMTASLAPRWPVARFSYSRNAYNCKHELNFSNMSYVRDRLGNRTSEECHSYYWDFGNGQTSHEPNPTVTYDQGGTYTVTLVASRSNLSCTDTMTTTITLPELREESTELHETICENSYYLFGTRVLREEGTYADTLSTFAGCDSIVTLHLTVMPTYKTQFSDTLCLGSGYEWEGSTYYTAGEFVKTLQSVSGCDSVVTLNLTNMSMEGGVEVGRSPDVCFGEPGFSFTARVPDICDSVFILFDDHLKAWGMADQRVQNARAEMTFSVPLTDSLTPGSYELTVCGYNRFCGWTNGTLPFTVRYSSGVMQQKWNDVISVLNRDYNGGYDFVAFQWYMNGQPLLGETHSYIYMPDTLTMGAEYSVLLTERNGRQMLSCPIVAAPRTDIQVTPTFVRSHAAVRVRTPREATAILYNAGGNAVRTVSLAPGTNDVQADVPQGIYLLRVVTADGSRQKSFRIVVQ